ncbi:MAG: hypothetical protein P1P64_01010 [Treponemataceae bacterium]
MTELEMAESAGNNIKVKLKTNKIIKGFCRGFTQAIDNDPEIAEIYVKDKTGRTHGFFQTEIESIEILE